MPSNYFSRFGASFWQGVQRSINVKESRIQDPIEVLIGRGKLLLGYSKSFHSVPSGTFSDLHVFLRPGTVAAAQANLHIVNRRKNISVGGAVSIPSVSGPPFQVCGYHIDRRLSITFQITFGINSQRVLMAVCGSRSAPADCSISNLISRSVQPGVAAYFSFTSYSRRSFDNCRKASMSLKNKEQPNNFLLYGYFIYNVAKRNGNSKPYPGFGFEGFYISSPACSSTGTASDVSFDSSMQEELHSSSSDSSDLYVPSSLYDLHTHMHSISLSLKFRPYHLLCET